MRYTDEGRAQWELAHIAEAKESVEERSDEHCATPSGRTGFADPAQQASSLPSRVRLSPPHMAEAAISPIWCRSLRATSVHSASDLNHLDGYREASETVVQADNASGQAALFKHGGRLGYLGLSALTLQRH